jgi:hypothetical protein
MGCRGEAELAKLDQGLVGNKNDGADNKGEKRHCDNTPADLFGARTGSGRRRGPCRRQRFPRDSDVPPGVLYYKSVN